MAVITFSRQFPVGHPKAGQPTYFVEKILNGFPNTELRTLIDSIPVGVKFDLNMQIDAVKHHTIRAGNRWKVGYKFSPRVWSGKPYNSKQIIIAPDIEIRKVWTIDIMKLDQGNLLVINGIEKPIDLLVEIAKNDGLELADLLLWFKFPKQQVTDFQIICWNDSINY